MIFNDIDSGTVTVQVLLHALKDLSRSLDKLRVQVSSLCSRVAVIERLSEDRGTRVNGKIADHSGNVGELEKQVLELIMRTSNIDRDVKNIDERSKRVYEQHDRMKIYLIITLVTLIVTLISKFVGI